MGDDSAAAAAAAFAAWDFAADAAWAAYAASVEVPDPTKLPLVRAKWYRKNMDSALDVDAVRATAGGKKAAPAPTPPPPPPPRRPAAPPPAAPPSASPSPLAALHRITTAGGASLTFLLDLATVAAAAAYLLRPPLFSHAAWTRFGWLAGLSHGARCVGLLGAPPIDLSGANPGAAVMAAVAWAVQAGRTTDGALLAFLVVAGRAPSPPAAVPAALLSAAHALEWGVSTAGTAAPAWAVRARAAAAARAPTLARAAAAAELAAGLLLTCGLFTGRAGLWTVLLFWRTYLPFRMRHGDGRHHAALLAGACGAAAGVVGGARPGVGAWLRAREGGLRARAREE